MQLLGSGWNLTPDGIGAFRLARPFGHDRERNTETGAGLLTLERAFQPDLSAMRFNDLA